MSKDDAATLLLAGGVLAVGVLGAASFSRPVQVGVFYYPYTVALVRWTAAPIPDFGNIWNETRMRAELQQMSDNNIQWIALCLKYDIDYDAQLTQTFFDLAGEYGLKVCILMDEPLTAEILQDRYLFSQQFRDHPAYFQLNGKPLLILFEGHVNPDFEASDFTVRHMYYGFQKNWVWFNIDGVVRLQQDSFSIIYPGLQDPYTLEWRVPRSPEFYRSQWDQVNRLGSKLVLIASFNEFWEGTFTQNNTLDGSVMMNITRTRGGVENGS